MISDEWGCIREHPALARYRLIRYRRRGYGGSVAHNGPFSLAQQASDALGVLTHFGLDRAHVVGHSYGGCTALQLAIQSPDSIHSLALLEPPIPVLPSAAALADVMAPAAVSYMSGDKAATVTALLAGLGGDDARQAIDKTLPGDWFDRAMTDVGSSLEVEGPALGEWMISDKDLAGISQPALTVVGAESIPWLQESVAWLSDHLPNAETFKLPAAGHMLHMIDPDGMATAIGAFFGRHPL